MVIHRNAKFCAIHAQGDSVYMWAEVQSGLETEIRKFYIAMTGETVPEPSYYIGSAFLQSGIVAHVFEIV